MQKNSPANREVRHQIQTTSKPSILEINGKNIADTNNHDIVSLL